MLRRSIQFLIVGAVTAVATLAADAVTPPLCTDLAEAFPYGDDPTFYVYRCQASCPNCPGIPGVQFNEYLGPFDVVGLNDGSNGEDVQLRILPNLAVPIPVEPTAAQRLIGAYIVWNYPVTSPGVGSLPIDISLRTPGDQVYFQFQLDQASDAYPRCVGVGENNLLVVGAGAGQPMKPPGCAPTPGSSEPGAIGFFVALPRAGRPGTPWIEYATALNAGQVVTPPELTTSVTAAAVQTLTLHATTRAAKLYFIVDSHPQWGDLVVTAPRSDSGEYGLTERGLIYRNDNSDSGGPAVDLMEDDPASKFLNDELDLSPELIHDVLMFDMPSLTNEFPYLLEVDGQLSPVVIDAPADFTTFSSGARISLGKDSGPCRLWLAIDTNEDGVYDAFELRTFPQEWLFDNPVASTEFCRLAGRPFSTTECGTPGLGWGKPYGLMVEAIGEIDDVIEIRFERKQGDTWILCDSTVEEVIGFGISFGDTGTQPFPMPPMGSYVVPRLDPAIDFYPPAPDDIEERMVPFTLESPIAFLQLTSSPLGGFEAPDGTQWVVRRPDASGGPKDPRYVTIDSFASGEWPGFVVESNKYFKLQVVPGMPRDAWSPLLDNLFVAHNWADPDLLKKRADCFGCYLSGCDMCCVFGMCGDKTYTICVPITGCACTPTISCDLNPDPCNAGGGGNSAEAPPNCPEPERCASGTTAGDPVNLFSGEFTLHVTDLRIPGRGMDFVWARSYRSIIGVDTAQGNGWDCGHARRIVAAGSSIALHDGRGRIDTYSFNKKRNAWEAPGFFRSLTLEPEGTYVLRFPDGSKWRFAGFDDTASAGRIISNIDRNNNSESYEYDAAGRLVSIVDTLGRPIVIAYNDDGFIASVTDFSGRQVRYEYYQDGDAGGTHGDLKSVTSPAVTGTPNGNDFPDGKTTTYTYSHGFDDARLNGNLLTIRDPLGQTFLRNVYGATEVPTEVEFDRVVRQYWGDQDQTDGDIIDMTYVPIAPSPEIGDAINLAIVNDRSGNVSHHYFDAQNRTVVHRRFTGRANPNQPTTLAENLPVNPLRPGFDPPYFETRTEYNENSLVQALIEPNGNSTLNVYESDLDAEAPVESRGNLRERHRFPGPLGGDQPVIVEMFEYDTGMGGGCCGSNFVTKEVDGRGNATLHEYDERGNRVRTTHRIQTIVDEYRYNEFGQMVRRIHPDNGAGHRRVDAFLYHETGPQRGYLKQSIVDAPHDQPGDPPDPPSVTSHFSLATSYEYDAVGNVVRVVDPRGNDMLYAVNALNQIVEEQSPIVSEAVPVRYRKWFFFDGNDNLVQVDVENRDEAGMPRENAWLSTLHEYEILNHRTATSRELDDLGKGAAQPRDPFLREERTYDANRNLMLFRSGEAVIGGDPFNTVLLLHDERDLPFRRVRAEGSPLQSTTQFDYDGNGNLIRRQIGLEDEPRVHHAGFDGFDRRVRSVDPMENVETIVYDANSNLLLTRLDGEIDDVAGEGGNVRLSEQTFTYDDEDRLIQTDDAFFVVETGAPIGDGLSTTKTVFNPDSSVHRAENDNAHGTVSAYDTAGRRSVLTDELGNSATFSYDANGNRVTLLLAEKSDLGSPTQMFQTLVSYDNLDRPVSIVDSVGSTTQRRYDSRSNLVESIDALGHVVRHHYDGLDRLLSTIRDLDGDGADGDGPDITTSQTWDDATRLVSQTDDNGNTTTYTFDALDRRTAETFADGTATTAAFDVHDNAVMTVDGNGSVVTSQYDLDNRLISKAIVPGAGVSPDTTAETFSYDGRSRLTLAEDNDSRVTRSYDSLSHVISETTFFDAPFTEGLTTVCVHDGVGNHTSCTYPSGRVVTCTFDKLERKKVISDADGMIATYSYIGPSRVERRDYGNGTRTTYEYDGILGQPNPPGDFGVQQIVRTSHTVIATGEVIDDRTYTWDRVGNKTRKKDIRPGGPRLTHDYAYDASYRLVHTTVTDAAAVVVRDTTYNLDGVHNRVSVTGAPDSGPYVGEYAMSEGSPFFDSERNQYSTIPLGERGYDSNGNLVEQAGVASMMYDYSNRLTEYIDDVRERTYRYRYDVFGRRIELATDASRGNVERQRTYVGWQAIEEADRTAENVTALVYGNDIDEMVFATDNDKRQYYGSDDMFNIVTLTNAVGAVHDRYEYDDYGQVISMSASESSGCAGDIVPDGTVNGADLGVVLGSWGACRSAECIADVTGDGLVDGADLGVVLGTWGECLPVLQDGITLVLFAGRPLDSESGLYYMRTRYTEPISGRFISRDTIGDWGDSLSTGNGYVWAGSNLMRWRDPFGLAPPPLPICERYRENPNWAKGTICAHIWGPYMTNSVAEGQTLTPEIDSILDEIEQLEESSPDPEWKQVSRLIRESMKNHGGKARHAAQLLGKLNQAKRVWDAWQSHRAGKPWHRCVLDAAAPLDPFVLDAFGTLDQIPGLREWVESWPAILMGHKNVFGE